METAVIFLTLFIEFSGTDLSGTIDWAAVTQAYLDKWDTSTEPRWELPSCLVGDRGTLEGVWRSGGGFESTQLSVSFERMDRYRVSLGTGGCLGAWRLERSAILEEGVLTLDRPAQEYARGPFTQLYLIRGTAGTFLVPSTALVELRAEYEQNGCGMTGRTPMSMSRMSSRRGATDVRP